MTTKEERYIKIAGYICVRLINTQVFNIKLLLIAVKNAYGNVTRKEFNKILELLNQTTAITGITKKNIYQTNTAWQYKYGRFKNIDELIQDLNNHAI